MWPLHLFAPSLVAREAHAGESSCSGDRPDHTLYRQAGLVSVGIRSLHLAGPGSLVQPFSSEDKPRGHLLSSLVLLEAATLTSLRDWPQSSTTGFISMLDISHQISPAVFLSFTIWQCLYFCSWSLIILSDFIKTTLGSH